MDFGTCPTGWHIEGDLTNQVAALAQVPLYLQLEKELFSEPSSICVESHS